MTETNPSAQLIFREVCPDEMPALLALYQHLHTMDASLPDKETLAAIWAEMTGGLDQYKRLHLLVAECQGQLVASCILIIIPNLTHGARPYGLIENVVTHADFRKRGIGRQLLQHALAIAWAQNCYKVMLLTGSKREETLRFYEQAGFKRGVKTGFIAYPEGA